MPEREIAKRGGASKWRTVTVGKGKKKRYVHVAVVPKEGTRGGRTVAGTPHTKKG